VSRGQRGGSPTVVNLSFLDIYIRFEKLAAVTIKNVDFWDVMPCASCNKNGVFLHSVRRLLVIANVVSSSTICHPDDGGYKFLRNVGS
jgi:hypothetical protein